MPSVKLYLAKMSTLPEVIRRALAAELPEHLAKETVVNHIIADVKRVKDGMPGPYAEVRGLSGNDPNNITEIANIVLRFIETEVCYPNGHVKVYQKGQNTH